MWISFKHRLHSDIMIWVTHIRGRPNRRCNKQPFFIREREREIIRSWYTAKPEMLHSSDSSTGNRSKHCVQIKSWELLFRCFLGWLENKSSGGRCIGVESEISMMPSWVMSACIWQGVLLQLMSNDGIGILLRLLFRATSQRVSS